MRPSSTLAPDYFPPEFSPTEGDIHVLVELPVDAASCKEQLLQQPSVDLAFRVVGDAAERTTLRTRPLGEPEEAPRAWYSAAGMSDSPLAESCDSERS